MFHNLVSTYNKQHEFYNKKSPHMSNVHLQYTLNILSIPSKHKKVLKKAM